MGSAAAAGNRGTGLCSVYGLAYVLCACYCTGIVRVIVRGNRGICGIVCGGEGGVEEEEEEEDRVE